MLSSDRANAASVCLERQRHVFSAQGRENGLTSSRATGQTGADRSAQRAISRRPSSTRTFQWANTCRNPLVRIDPAIDSSALASLVRDRFAGRPGSRHSRNTNTATRFSSCDSPAAAREESSGARASTVSSRDAVAEGSPDRRTGPSQFDAITECRTLTSSTTVPSCRERAFKPVPKSHDDEIAQRDFREMQLPTCCLKFPDRQPRRPRIRVSVLHLKRRPRSITTPTPRRP